MIKILYDVDEGVTVIGDDFELSGLAEPRKLAAYLADASRSIVRFEDHDSGEVEWFPAEQAERDRVGATNGECDCSEPMPDEQLRCRMCGGSV